MGAEGRNSPVQHLWCGCPIQLLSSSHQIVAQELDRLQRYDSGTLENDNTVFTFFC